MRQLYAYVVNHSTLNCKWADGRHQNKVYWLPRINLSPRPRSSRFARRFSCSPHSTWNRVCRLVETWSTREVRRARTRVGVARGAAGSNCSLLFVKHSTVNEPPCLALQKPFVIFCVKKKAFNNLTSRVPLQRPLNWCPYLFIIYVIFWWTITILGTVLYLGSFRSSTRNFVLLPIWCLTGSAS